MFTFEKSISAFILQFLKFLTLMEQDFLFKYPVAIDNTSPPPPSLYNFVPQCSAIKRGMMSNTAASESSVTLHAELEQSFINNGIMWQYNHLAPL